MRLGEKREANSVLLAGGDGQDAARRQVRFERLRVDVLR